MAMTPYTGETLTIANIGTTPQERAMETSEFKMAFSKDFHEFVEWFNDTHKTDFDAVQTEITSHMAENVSQVIYAARGISLDGVQIITGLIGIPERIEIRAIITDWAKASISIGSWEKNGFAHTCYSILTTQGGSVISYSSLSCDVQVFDDEFNYLKGIIQNVTPTQFEILWLNDNTSPSGTVILQIIVYYHGGN